MTSITHSTNADDIKHVDWVRPSALAGDSGFHTVKVTVPTLDVLLADIKARFEQQQGFSLATLNLDHVVKLREDKAFHEAYLAQSHVTADGNPIVWLSRFARVPVSLLAGADLIAPLAELAGSTGVAVGLLGSPEETLQAAADALMARHAGLKVVTLIAPPMGFDPTGDLADTYIAELKTAGVGLCFLALGAPKQELFAAHAVTKVDSIGFVSIGAGLDFIAGSQTRAPAIFRFLAAEWLWRLATNPKRLAKRYAACFAELPRLTVSAFRARRINKRNAD